MFLLFGTRPKVDHVVTVHYRCPYCGADAPQQVYRQRNQFTLFFVLPLFSFGKAHFVQCTNCGNTTDLTEQQVANALARTATNRG